MNTAKSSSVCDSPVSRTGVVDVHDAVDAGLVAGHTEQTLSLEPWGQRGTGGGGGGDGGGNVNAGHR